MSTNAQEEKHLTILRQVTRVAGYALGLAVLVVLVLGLLVSSGVSPNPAVGSMTQSQARLTIKAPKKVNVGQVIELKLRVKNATDLAGYEAAVLYDGETAEFAGVHQPTKAMQKMGRDLVPLTVVQTPSGAAAIGFASCPVNDCLKQDGSNHKGGVQGNFKLGTLDLIPLKAGLLEIKLDALKFVDAKGNSVAVDVPVSTLNIQVGNDTTAISSPSASWVLDRSPSGTAGPFSVTQQERVSHADAMEVAMEWTVRRERGNPCQDLGDPRLDVNHDGCIDVADLQAVLAHLGTVGKAPSQQEQAVGALNLVVNTTVDTWDARVGDGICRTAAGACTLRAAIQEANAHTGPDNISFGIPGSGVQTIQLNSALYTIWDTTGGVTIDGYTQPGAAPNTAPDISNAVIRIEVVGQGESNYDAIRISSGNNVIRGLAVYNAHRAFWIYGANADNNNIVGNFIGTNASGSFGATTTGDSQASGVHVEQGASGNRIGGTAPADRNVISGNARSGASFWHGGTDNNNVIGNIVGTNPGVTTRRPNRQHGVDMNFGSSNNRVGGSNPGERNIISGNNAHGVEVSHTAQTTQNQVIGNYIGTNATGNSSAANLYNGRAGISVKDRAKDNIVADNVVAANQEGGIRIDNYGNCCLAGNQFTGNRVGIGSGGASLPNELYGIWINAPDSTIGPNNIIANNHGPGIKVEGSDNDRNRITRNSIYNNAGLGIDIAPIGQFNQNDGGDEDSGPNEQLNFPVILDASPTYVSGSACPGCTIEVFVAESGPGQHGEGRTFVTSTTAQGNGDFDVALSGINDGDIVTTTATDSDGNTSEFGLNVAVSPPIVDWTSLDIGTTYAGSTNIAGNSISVRGSGRDIWSSQDGFRYVYQSASTDLDLTTYISAWDGKSIHSFSKAGLMFRSSTAADSQNIFIMVTGTNGIRMTWRTSKGGTSQVSTGPALTAPVWLRLVKVNNAISAYYSTDNSNWIQVGATQNINLGPSYLYGMAVTSHLDGEFVNATFDNTSTQAPNPSLVMQSPSSHAARSVHIGDLKAKSNWDDGTWAALIDITVHDENHEPLPLATAIANWSGDSDGQNSCITDQNGQCSLIISEIPPEVGKVVLRITDVRHDSAAYAPELSHRANKPKSGTRITLKIPKQAP